VALRAVYDANVLISGLVFEGLPGRCLDAVEAGSVRCVTSWGILREVIEKLTTKFRHADELLLDELG
jgi:predicted nucleic acid-binding protein